jgi:hypothetical protein
MRKMLHLVFAVWKTGKAFDPKHHPWEQTPQVDNEHVDTDTADSQREAVERPTNETVAGRKEQSSKRQAVTATSSNVEPTPRTIKNTSVASQASVQAAVLFDFAALREQITIEQALSQLGHFEHLQGNATQRRGPCPIHGSQRPASRSFSVNLQRNLFQCFSPTCQAHGNVLDLWAAIHNLTLYEAAKHLAATFGSKSPTK